MPPVLSSSTAPSIQLGSGGAEKEKNSFAPMVKFIRNITQSRASVTPQDPQHQSNITTFQQYSKLAAFLYTGKVNEKDWFMAKAPSGMTKDNPCLTPQFLSSELSTKHKKEGFRLSTNGNIVCSESGLTASVGINYKEKTVAVVFGGTTSGESNSSSLMTRAWKNLLFVAQQSKANLCNALTRHTPKSYSQASQMVKELAEIIPKDYRIVTVGHSKGAAEAEYAAISNFSPGRPIEAYCFSSAKLNHGSYEKAMSNQSPQVADYIHHCFVEGDWIPRMGFGRHVGGVTYVPYYGSFSPINAHDKFDKHIQRYFEKFK